GYRRGVNRLALWSAGGPSERGCHLAGPWRKLSGFTPHVLPETCANSCRPSPSPPWHRSCCTHLGEIPEMTTSRSRATLVLLCLVILPSGAEPATKHLHERGTNAQAETQADLARPPESPAEHV